ncbi:MAG: hypothetical protein JRN15_22520 [Nitrososphaerota archaeon]|nr:hypothetical protein [Nitrososphaerota archaeon]
MESRQKATLIGAIIIIGVAFVLTSNVNVFGTTAPGQVGYIVPLYISPDYSSGQTAWNSLIAVKQAYPSVPIIAIINPDSGPGTSKDATYAAYIQDLQNAGITVLGYVWTCYGTRTYTGGGTIQLSACGTVGTPYSTGVEDDMNSYKSWYGVNGILLDEMNTTVGGAPYYSNLTTYAHGNSLTPVIGNPGTATSSSYVGSVDVIISYEGSGLPSTATVAAVTTSTGGIASQWGVVAYSQPSAPTQSYISSVAPYIAWIYATDAGLPNPYDVLPTYQTTEVANLVVPTGGGGPPATTSTVVVTSTSTPTQVQQLGAAAPNPVSEYTHGVFTSEAMLAYFAVISVVVAGVAAFLFRDD